MLIGIEASRANKPLKTGVEWYAWHLIQELKKVTMESPHSWMLYTNDVLRGGLEALPRNWFDVRAHWPFPYGWTQFRLSWELFRRPADVLFLPCSTMPRYTPKRTVVTVHDVGFRRYPQLYKARQVRIHDFAMREIKRRASRVVTVSEFSKREIIDAYGIEPERISVTPNGIDHVLFHPITDQTALAERLARHDLSSPYLVTIGRLEVKKNLITLIRAFSRVAERDSSKQPLRLALIGVPGFGIEEIRREIRSSAAPDRIVELGYVPEEDLPFILAGAQALVHPSWYEGFGLPPIQAMACGCPVIASSAGSLPEIVGRDAGLLVPPNDPEAFTAAIERIRDDVSLRDKLRSAGLKRAEAFSWRRTAELTLPLLTTW